MTPRASTDHLSILAAVNHLERVFRVRGVRDVARPFWPTRDVAEDFLVDVLRHDRGGSPLAIDLARASNNGQKAQRALQMLTVSKRITGGDCDDFGIALG
jgi:hypothetical protein